MPNPFQPLQKALRTLVENAEILPATGQAVTDMVTPDIEEIYDRHTTGEATIHTVWETDARSLYRTIQPIPRSQEHGFRYFVDGSARTYFIGTLLEQGRSTPVQISQVGAAMVKREDDGRIQVAASRHTILLTLEKSQVSEELWQALEEAIRGIPGYDLCDSATNNTYADIMGLHEPRPRGAHRANWYMRQLEVELALTVPREENAWLVVDGSLGNEFENWRGAPLIGVAKTFRRDTQFELGTGPRAKKLNLFTLLKDLQENQRTIVFPRGSEGKIVFWYVRIRPQKALDYPLMGVVKVEMPNPDREPVDSALVDRISGWLIAERTVTPYGRDGRWHVHLYPIYIAERVIRARFYSEEVLRSGVRWPFQVASP
ncbi:DNA double-strand break repair nuclease NurA [Rhodothermus marinus]|uniref:DNA double-strand break repair nuclease NurA n=1 Tax=Rhodothermus marinus TaxID=29549 RepID=UPI0006CF776C|nr:DNA double-strand break repair nuclease NurA [Rhodothermus marinus]